MIPDFILKGDSIEVDPEVEKFGQLVREYRKKIGDELITETSTWSFIKNMLKHFMKYKVLFSTQKGVITIKVKVISNFYDSTAGNILRSAGIYWKLQTRDTMYLRNTKL